jgi:hypothetical protein
MRKSRSIIRILFFILGAIGIPALLSAQVYSEKREQGKSFKLKSSTVIQINNKYGNVNVLPWEKDSVRIDVSISAQSKQASKVVKILSTIDCEMIATANTISARTVFYDNSATFWKDVVSYAGQVINTSNNLQINYTVYMPVSNDIKIENKFGNVYMDSHIGNADITVSNGDIQARNFTRGLKLKIEFGAASFQDAADAHLIINYSDLTARKIHKLNLNSRSSTIDIEEAGVTELVSSRDKLVVKACNSLSGEASFSRIRINELEAMCTINSKYGELKLNAITRDFRNINIKSEYTDIFMGFNPSDSYSMELVYDAKTNLNISAPINDQLTKETLNAKAGTIHATGNIGKSGSSHVSVTAKAGSLSVLNK